MLLYLIPTYSQAHLTCLEPELIISVKKLAIIIPREPSLIQKFSITDASEDINVADLILDFTDGTDIIELENKTFADLTIK